MRSILKDVQAARIIAADTLPGVTADECYDFGDIMGFLWENPDYVAARRGRAGRPNILLEDGVKSIAGAWYAGKRKPRLKIPQTASDPAVQTVLESGFKFPPNSNTTQTVVRHHYFAMAAENIIGSLLEMYIDSELHKHGWIWCSGEIVKAVDFLKWDDPNEAWVPLQVKNRSNSENSSSMAIRNGTAIVKWHRLNANNGKTLWDKFPDPSVRGRLSEKGFQEYIKEQLG